MAKPRTPLRRAIFESDWTQRRLAEFVGISESRMSIIVAGLHPDKATRDRISAALGRDSAELWPLIVDERDEREAA